MIVKFNNEHLLNAHCPPALTDLILTMYLSPTLAWGGASVLSWDSSTYRRSGTSAVLRL